MCSVPVTVPHVGTGAAVNTESFSPPGRKLTPIRLFDTGVKNVDNRPRTVRGVPVQTI